MDHVSIAFKTLLKTVSSILQNAGVSPIDEERCSKVIVSSTADGVISHGLGRLPRLVSQIKKGEILLDRTVEKTSRSETWDVWNGNNGIGIINALEATDRSMELASHSGMGMVALNNTTHWLRGGTYGWRAADKGYAFIGWTNTIANMAPWGSSKNLLGNNPLVMAFPSADGNHFVLDMAMSQYSYGTLNEYSRLDRRLPSAGGWNTKGEMTDNPGEVLQSGRVLPSGLWKGSSLSMMLDLLASSFSLGNATGNINNGETDISQLFISFSLTGEMTHHSEAILAEIRSSLKNNTSKTEKPRYPGQRAYKTRQNSLKEGIKIPESLWSEIENLM